MNSPVVVLPSGEEKKVLSTSPTSTADVFMDCDSHLLKQLDVDSTVNRMTSASELTVPTLLGLKNANMKRNSAVLKTVHHADVKLVKPFSSVLELKTQLCEESPINKNDIMIIKDGKELRNETVLSELPPKSFVLLRTSVSTSVPVALKPQGIEGGMNKTLKIPLNMRVFQLKKQLYSSKFTTLKPESQRIIVGGKVLHDSYLIGDYLLPSILGKKSTCPSPSAIAASVKPSTSSSSTTAFKPSIPVVATLYLSKTVNVKHEVDVEIPLTNGSIITCPLEISQPISTLVKILNRRHFFPLPNDEFFYIFSLKVPRTSSLVDKTSSSGSTAFGPFHQLKKTIEADAKKSTATSSSASKGFELVELDLNKTLIDYGFTQSTKKITVEIARSHNLRPDDSRPVEFSEMLFIYLVAIAERRVQRQAQGLPMDEPGPIQMSIPVPVRMPLHPPSSSSSSGSRRSRSGTNNMMLMAGDDSTIPSSSNMPSASEVQQMLEAMGMDKDMVRGILSGADPRGMSGIDVVPSSSVNGSSIRSSSSVSSSGSSVSKKRSTPDVSSSEQSAAGSGGSKTSSGPTSKKSTTSNSKGGLFGGLKKGFLSGGGGSGTKKDGK